MISKEKQRELGVPGKAQAIAEVWTKHLALEGAHETEEDDVFVVFCCWGFDPKACKSKGFRSLGCCCFTCGRAHIVRHAQLDPSIASTWKCRGVGEMHPTS